MTYEVDWQLHLLKLLLKFTEGFSLTTGAVLALLSTYLIVHLLTARSKKSEISTDALVERVESALSVGPMDPAHLNDRFQYGGTWSIQPPLDPSTNYDVLQGRRSAAKRAVEAVLDAQKGAKK